MGWKGTLRSYNASVKRYEREAQKDRNAKAREQQRLHRELVQKQIVSEKKEQQNRAKEDVCLFEDYVNSLITLHKRVPAEINWLNISTSSEPEPPCMQYKKKKAAIEAFESFKPTFMQKILKRANKIRHELQQKIVLAEEKDKQHYQQSLDKFKTQLSAWKYDVELSKRVLNFDQTCFKEIIDSKGTFQSFCSRATLAFDHGNKLTVSIYINGQDVVPTESKSLLKSGKVSIKSLPKTKYHELYQDYVCSMAFRVSREIFALLPIDNVIVTIFDVMLDQSTGHLDDQPILSLLVIKETLGKLNLNSIDPSDALINFKHNMSFKRTAGFSKVDVLED